MDVGSPGWQYRRRLAQLWNIPESQILLNISVATANDTLAAADAPALGAFANLVNVSVVSMSNLYQSFCVEPMPSPPPAPPPPPMPPGAAQIEGQITLSGDLATFDEASFKTNLANQLSADCSCTINAADIAVSLTPGSVVVDYVISAPDAAAADAAASTLTNTATLSTALSISVIGAAAFPSPPSAPPPPPPFECGPGTHEDGSQFVCINCEAGKYNDLTAQATCSDCTAGYYCPPVPPFGAINPKPCPGGTYSAATNLVDASGCTTVEAGFYAPLGSNSRIPCPTIDVFNCPGGTALPVGNVGGGGGLEASCPAGTVEAGVGASSDCQPCYKGHYCRGGVANPCADGQWLNMTGIENATACNVCPSDTICPPGTAIPNVRDGFFLSDPLNGRPAYRCPNRDACLGGLEYGERSCELGYSGLLCGGCVDGYYRGKGSCLSCAALAEDMASSGQQIDMQASKNSTMLLMVGGSAALVLVLALYLRDPTKKPMFTIADIGNPIYFEEGEDWAGGGTTSIEMGISGLSWVRVAKPPKDGVKIGAGAGLAGLSRAAALSEALLCKTVESVAEKRSGGVGLSFTLAEWTGIGGEPLTAGGGLNGKYLKKCVSSLPATANGVSRTSTGQTTEEEQEEHKKYVFFVPLDASGLKWLCTTKAPPKESERLVSPGLAKALCGKACELAERKQHITFSEAEYREINIERLNTSQYTTTDSGVNKFGVQLGTLYYMPSTSASSATTLVKREKKRASKLERSSSLNSGSARWSAKTMKGNSRKQLMQGGVICSNTVKEAKVRMYKQGAGSAPELRDDGLFIRNVEMKIGGLVQLEDGSIFLNPSGSAASASSKVLGHVGRCLEKYPAFANGLRTFTGGRAPSILSGLVKIMISFMQCIGAVKRFPLVKWPKLFTRFLERLAIIDIEIFSVIPAECLTGKRLGFYFELFATLMVPILFCGLVLILITLIHVCFMCLRVNKQMRAKSRFWWSKGLGAEFNQPRVYVLMSWCALLFYPTIARKSIQTLACTEAGVDEAGNTLYLMLADPEIRCWQDSHLIWVGISVGAILLYCIGIPALAFYLCKQWRSDTGINFERIALLIKTYEDDYWYGESISMLHRLFLTGVIHVISPQSRLQLWVGSFFCFFVFVGFLLTQPLRYDTCDFVATTVLLQLFLTYLTAFLFFDDEGYSVLDPEADEYGYMLVALNSACFVVLLYVLARRMYVTAKEMANGRLRFKDDQTPVHLEPITAKTLERAAENRHGVIDKAFHFALPKGYHLFLSHAWPAGQDVMKICKQRCGLMVPTMRVFLDVDDLTEGSGKTELDHSAVVLVYAMTAYFKKQNCVKELFRAILRKKPIVLLLADCGEEGAMTEDEVRATITQKWVDEWFNRRLKIADKWRDDFERPPVTPTAEEVVSMIFASPALTWSRITFLQNVTMRILGHMSLASGVDSKLASRLVELRSDTVWRATRLRAPIGHGKQGGKKSGQPKEYHLFVSRYNVGALEVAMELGEVIHEGLGATQLKVTSDLGKLHECENFLVLLSGATWAIDENATSRFEEELYRAFHLCVPLLTAYEAPTTVQDGQTPSRLTWERTSRPEHKEGHAIGWKGSLGDVHGRDLGEGNRPRIEWSPLQTALQHKFEAGGPKAKTVSFSPSEWQELKVEEGLKVFDNLKARQLNVYHVIANGDASEFYQPCRLDRKAIDFDTIMSNTPPELTKDPSNIFKKLAVPLRVGAWREAGLRSLYAKMVATQKSLRVRRSVLSIFGLGHKAGAPVEKPPAEASFLMAAEAMKAQRTREQLDRLLRLFVTHERTPGVAAKKIQTAARRMIWINKNKNRAAEKDLDNLSKNKNRATEKDPDNLSDRVKGFFNRKELAYDKLDSDMLAKASDAVLKRMSPEMVSSMGRLIKMGSLPSSFMDAVEGELGIGERAIRPRREELVEIVTGILMMRRHNDELNA